MSLLGEFREALEAREEVPFLVVWAIHNGVYVGLAAGVAWAVLARRALAREPGAGRAGGDFAAGPS